MRWIIELLFVLQNFILRVLQSALKLIYGPGRNAAVAGCVDSYVVLADVKPPFRMINEKRFFLHKFSGIKDVSYLDRNDVTLYEVTEEEFVFVRVAPGVDIFNTEEHPFTYSIQQSAAEEILTVPHETVYEYLKKKPERDGGNIAFLHNHGRCGSTLVAAMMFRTKQCVVQSEPTPVLHLALMFNKKDYPASRKTVEYVDLVRATFLLLCPDSKKLYFIKPWGVQTLSLLPLLHQALPGIKELFMFRSIRPTVQSFKRLLAPKGQFNMIGNWAVARLPSNYRNIWEKVKHGAGDEVWCYLMLSEIHAYILETRDRDDIKSYSYESLLARKEEFTRSFLKEVGIGQEYVESALSALEKDSQANSDSHNQEKVAGVKTTVSDEAMEWVSGMARDEFGIEMTVEDGRIVDVPNQWQC